LTGGGRAVGGAGGSRRSDGLCCCDGGCRWFCCRIDEDGLGRLGTIVRQFRDCGWRICPARSAVGNIFHEPRSRYLHPGMTVEIQVLVPLIFVVDMYPVLPPILVGNERYGASVEGAYRATLASDPMSLQPRGWSMSISGLESHSQPHDSGLWQTQVSLTTPG
jgi:hypothetical protein